MRREQRLGVCTWAMNILSLTQCLYSKCIRSCTSDYKMGQGWLAVSTLKRYIPHQPSTNLELFTPQYFPPLSQLQHNELTPPFLLPQTYHYRINELNRIKNDGHRRYPRLRRPRHKPLFPRVRVHRLSTPHAAMGRRTRCFGAAALAGRIDGQDDGEGSEAGPPPLSPPTTLTYAIED